MFSLANNNRFDVRNMYLKFVTYEGKDNYIFFAKFCSEWFGFVYQINPCFIQFTDK